MRLLFSLTLLAFVFALPLGCEKKSDSVKDSPQAPKDKPGAPPPPPPPPPPPK